MGEVVLYVAGGAMRGVFSAGVLHALSEVGVRNHISAIYGISAGAFNAAQFALGTTHRAPEWYCNHVPNRNIIRTRNPLVAFRGQDALDFDTAEEILLNEHFIDAISNCATPVSFGVVNAQTKVFSFVDARRDDAIKLLLATSTIYPFLGSPVVIDGEPYIDGGYRETVCLDTLRARHPGAKFIIVLNADVTPTLRESIARLIVRLKDPHLARVWYESEGRALVEYIEAQDAADVILIAPQNNFAVELATTDIPKIEEGWRVGYETGKREAQRVLAFVQG